MSLVISNIVGLPPTAPGGLGSIRFDAVSSAANINAFAFDGSAVVIGSYTGPPGVGLLIPDLPEGTCALSFINDDGSDGQSVPIAVVPGSGSGPAVPGCTDPESDNYDPNATYNDGSCFISPRLTLAEELPALVANGRPVWVTLNSPAIAGAVPAKADGFINLELLGSTAGVELVVNGYRLESGPVLLATNFADAPSLVEALNAIGPLAAAYDIHQSQDDEVRLTAWAEGTRFNLDLSSSDAGKVMVVALDGVNRYHSQRRQQWGCYLEVWAGAPQTNPSTFADLYSDVYRDTYGELTASPGGAPRPVLAQRIELPYRADNAYRFEISKALQKFTDHAYPQADGSCPDRLCSFFLKFGEVYATADSIRRQRNAYVSGVSWALDAVEIVEPFDYDNQHYLLSSRPLPWRSYRARCAPSVLLGNTSGTGTRDVLLGGVTFGGGVSSQFAPTADEGTVRRLDLSGGFFDSMLRGNVAVGDAVAGVTPIVDYDFEVEGPGHALTFANGQGGHDTFIFEGLREELTKYAPSGYATGTGIGTRSATTPEAFRLNSGPLTRAEYLWLRRELGNTPAVWYETPGTPQAVSLTAFSPDPDEVKAEYFLAVDCQPQEQPALGLTN